MNQENTNQGSAAGSKEIHVFLIHERKGTDLEITLQSLKADGIEQGNIQVVTAKTITDKINLSDNQIVSYINAGDLWMPGKRDFILKTFPAEPGPRLLLHRYYEAKPTSLRYKLEIHKHSKAAQTPLSASLGTTRGVAPADLKPSGKFPLTFSPRADLPQLHTDLTLGALKDRSIQAVCQRWGSILRSRHHRGELSLAHLSDRFRNQRCFILGNGPSLNQTDLSRLENEIVLTSNRFYLHFPNIAWRPTCHACIDAAVLPDIAEELTRESRDNPDTLFFFPRFLGDDQLARVRWSTPTLIPPASNIAYFQERSASSPEQVCSPALKHFLHRVPTVTGTLLQLALLGGASSIYLLGCDTDYAPMPGARRIPSGHDTGTTRWQTLDGDDPNHFHPDYFGPGRIWREPRPERMLAFYEALRKQIDPQGARIFNATPGGRLDVYPRVAFESLFA